MTTIEDFGEVYSVYFAHATDEQIRFSASSGGFCKGFLLFLIEHKVIDEAIITRTGPPKSPFKPETIITNSKQDIISTRTNSVYAPNNPLKVLNKIEPQKSYAITVLGCHCRELRLKQSMGIAKNIGIVIGLLCNHTPKIKFARDIINKLNIREKDIKQIEYRGHGWPGKFSVYLTNNEIIQEQFLNIWSNDLNNGPKCCRSCKEISMKADIVACDPWGLGREKYDKIGTTLIVCRNKKSDDLVVSAEKKGYIVLEKCTREDFIKSQGSHIANKFLNERKNEKR